MRTIASMISGQTFPFSFVLCFSVCSFIFRKEFCSHLAFSSASNEFSLLFADRSIGRRKKIKKKYFFIRTHSSKLGFPNFSYRRRKKKKNMKIQRSTHISALDFSTKRTRRLLRLNMRMRIDETND